MTESQKKVWYAMRVTYSREMVLKEYLDKNGIENFIPLEYKLITRGEKQVRMLVPVVHNLVFIRSIRKQIEELKIQVAAKSPIRYIMDKGTHTPIIIPEKQMKDFITVAGSYDEQHVYVDPIEVSFKKGDKVRVIGGPFAGIEGELIRIKGDRRVVVSIEGVMAVATAFIHPSMLEVIDEH